MIDDVLRELEAVGTVESEGEFTLDRAKAREKMRRFQLADPRAYVLELVQAAGLKGASRVRFDIDSRDMVMALDGRPFTVEDFDDIYGAALSRRLDPDVLARRQLALGLNSAMALRPTQIVVESGDGQSGARLRLRPDEEDELGSVQTSVVGTRIHVRERFALGTFVSFFKNLRGTLAEEQLLRVRCTYASFEIDLEGARIDAGLRLGTEPVIDLVEHATTHTRVAGGIRESLEGLCYLRIIKDGVWITDHVLPGERFPAGFVAVVQDHALRKEVSQGDVVRDDAYDTMLTVVQAAAFRAVAALAARFEAGEAPSWAELMLLRELTRLDHGSVKAVDEATGRIRALRRLVLWEATDRRTLCLDQILAEADDKGNVAFTSSSRFEGLPLPSHSFVIYVVGVDDGATYRRSILTRILGKRLLNVTDVLQRAYAREKARRAWRSRPSRPVLPEGSYLVRRLVEGPGVRGEVGIVGAPTEQTHVGLISDGCMIIYSPFGLPWLGLRVVVEAEAFQPTDSYVDIMRDAATFRALLPVGEQIAALYGDLKHAPASSWRDACARSLLDALLRGETVGMEFALRVCDVAKRLATAEVDAFGRERMTVELDPLGPSPHPLATMPLFPTLGPQRYSLKQLCERAREGEALEVVERAEPGISASEILVLDDEDRELLQPLFARRFVDASTKVRKLVRERDFVARPTFVPRLDGAAPAVLVPIEGGGEKDRITGMLRVDPSKGAVARAQPITVLHRGRAIAGIPLLLVGRCEGWVEGARVVPQADFAGVRSNPGLDMVRAAVLRAFAAACLRIAERWATQRDAKDLAFLREVLALPFPTRGIRSVYDKLERSKSVSRAKLLETHARLYAALHLAGDSAGLEQRMWRAARAKRTVDELSGVESPKRGGTWALAAVDVLFPPAGEHDRMAERVLRPVPALAELAVTRGRTDTVLHVDTFTTIDMGERVVVLADAEQVERFRRMLGTSRMLNGEAAVERQRQRQTLQQRPKVESIALPPGEAMVYTRWEQTHGRKQAEGEVGLAREHLGDPSRMPRLTVRLHRERVEIETATVPDQPAELCASINDDRLSLTVDFKSIHRNKAFETLVESCEAKAPELVAQLVARWDHLASAARKTAWYHVLDYLRAQRPGSLRSWDSEGVVGQWYASAASLPGFFAVGGTPWSAAQLAQLHERRGLLEVLPAPWTGWGESPLPPDRPVICVDAYELAVLRAMFSNVENVQVSWSLWKERAANFRASPMASALEAVPSLVSHVVQAPGLEGWLAIPAADGPVRVELCAEGRVVTRRVIEPMLPCVGSIRGDWVEPDERFAEAILDPRAEAALPLACVQLYRALGQWFRANPEHPQRGRVATLLAAPVVTLAKKAQTLELSWQLLLAELRELPVLSLLNGRRISLKTALQERPDELGHLDLWPARAHRLEQKFEIALPPEAEVEAEAEVVDTPPRPKPPEPTPAERLVEAVRAELRLVRHDNRELLAEIHLDRIRVDELPRKQRALVAWADRGGVVVNGEHPVVKRALAPADPADPVWVSYVASAVYTALNVWLEEITDAHEQRFVVQWARLAASG